MEIFKGIPAIRYEGADSKNPLAFKFYDADRVILGKKMSEHLPFAMAWWHNLCATGVDMFGRGTADKSFGAEPGTMAHAKAKVDAGFEFMQKMGIRYFCWHDVDLVPEADDIKETNRRLDEISDYILVKMKETGIKCLWGTANMFGNPRFMNGAGSTNSADVFAFAAAQVKKALDILINAKTQRTSVCNAAESLLVHRDIAPVFLPQAADALISAGVYGYPKRDAFRIAAEEIDEFLKSYEADVYIVLFGGGALIAGDVGETTEMPQ